MQTDGNVLVIPGWRRELASQVSRYCMLLAPQIGIELRPRPEAGFFIRGKPVAVTESGWRVVPMLAVPIRGHLLVVIVELCMLLLTGLAPILLSQRYSTSKRQHR